MDMLDKIIDTLIETLFDVDEDNCIYALNEESRRVLRNRLVEVFKEYDRL